MQKVLSFNEMNRRRFLELLGTAALGSGIVYLFPSIIVPKNIAPITKTLLLKNGIFKIIDSPEYEFGFSGYKESNFNKTVIAEIYPRLIDNIFLTDSPDEAYWRKRLRIIPSNHV